ncbi:MAG: OmpH family outer membrane protein [Rhodospirillales bacterium]|nr:OmpH family outer membrane protein [Rhodospirillales bacterium]
MKALYRTPILALFGLLIFVSPSLAQKASPAKGGKPPDDNVIGVVLPIGILDVQSILKEAKAVKNIRDQVTKFGSKFEEEIEKERNEIRKANQELARQRTILAPEAFAEKRRKFEQRVVEVQRLVQTRQRSLDKSRNEAMVSVNKAYTAIVSKIANEKNLAIIVRKSQTAFSVKSLDLTQEILARLDKQLPSVKVADPGKK